MKKIVKNAVLVDKDTNKVGEIKIEDGKIVEIGSGGNYALSAARALVENTDLSAREIVEKSLKIAGDICVFTNTNFTIEELPNK